MQKTIYEQIETQVDKETGEEIQTASSTVRRLPSEPAFVKMYIDDLSVLLDIKEGPKNLIWLLIRHMNYEGTIALTRGPKRRIAEELGITEKTFRNYLWSLSKSKIIHRIDHNEYEFNPSYFARGDWASIYQRRKAWAKLEVRYGPDGRREVTGKVMDDQKMPESD